jgi:hypothetical protein
VICFLLQFVCHKRASQILPLTTESFQPARASFATAFLESRDSCLAQFFAVFRVYQVFKVPSATQSRVVPEYVDEGRVGIRDVPLPVYEGNKIATAIDSSSEERRADHCIRLHYL